MNWTPLVLNISERRLLCLPKSENWSRNSWKWSSMLTKKSVRHKEPIFF